MYDFMFKNYAKRKVTKTVSYLLLGFLSAVCVFKIKLTNRISIRYLFIQLINLLINILTPNI